MMLSPAIIRWCAPVLAATALLSAGGPRAEAQALPRTFVLIVSGASGEPAFAVQMHTQALALRTAASRFGVPDSLITYLAEDPAADPRVISGKSSRDGVEKAIASIAVRARAGDDVFILLLGHGSAEGDVSKFNLPGPDLTASDFAALLGRLAGETVALVNATNSSGDFVKALSGPRRVIITATRTARESNETLFGQHFVDAYAADGADTDKDGRVSLLEAFAYASREVKREYEQTNRLQTEHALLDDDGDGEGHTDASDAGPDGLVARSFFLAPAAGVSAALANDPRAVELLATQRRLQAQIDSLRAFKASMKEDDYQQALDPLLLKLAETSRALRALEPKKP